MMGPGEAICTVHVQRQIFMVGIYFMVVDDSSDIYYAAVVDGTRGTALAVDSLAGGGGVAVDMEGAAVEVPAPERRARLAAL